MPQQLRGVKKKVVADGVFKQHKGLLSGMRNTQLRKRSVSVDTFPRCLGLGHQLAPARDTSLARGVPAQCEVRNCASYPEMESGWREAHPRFDGGIFEKMKEARKVAVVEGGSDFEPGGSAVASKL